jgi:hypothetical protein
MPDRLLPSPPTPGQLITELHAWVATYADGTEGIIAGELPGMGMTPLITSRRAVAESLEELARRAQRLTMHTRHRVVRIRLVTFTSTEGTRQ